MGTRMQWGIFLGALLCAGGLSAATPAELSREQSQKESRDILRRLQLACPESKAMLRAVEGYATFAGVGPGSKGGGVAAPTRTRQEVYMRFEAAPATTAIATSDLVFLFTAREDLSRFVFKGASLGGPVPPTAKAACGQSLAPGIRVIQLQGDKLATGVVPKALYRKDSTLN